MGLIIGTKSGSGSVSIEKLKELLETLPDGQAVSAQVALNTLQLQGLQGLSLSSYENGDFAIADENGNVLVKFADGHIQTKNFDSRKTLDTWWNGKNVAIIGDSISTNGNSGVDKNSVEITIGAEDVGKTLSAFPTHQDIQANLTIGGHSFTMADVGTEVSFVPTSADVGKVIGIPLNYNPNNTTTWWEVAQNALGFTSIPVCWSGSSITSHEDSTTDKKCSFAWHESQIRKCGIRQKGTMNRTSPDVIIIYRGTNDFSHTPYTKLTSGYFDSVPFNYPTTDVISNGYGFVEGYVLTIKKLREAYPHALIMCCTLNVFKRVNCTTFPTNNGVNTLPQYNKAIRDIADFMGCGLIDFEKDGITFENCYPTYISDSSTNPTHPNDNGHKQMARKAVADMINFINSL